MGSPAIAADRAPRRRASSRRTAASTGPPARAGLALAPWPRSRASARARSSPRRDFASLRTDAEQRRRPRPVASWTAVPLRAAASQAKRRSKSEPLRPGDDVQLPVLDGVEVAGHRDVQRAGELLRGARASGRDRRTSRRPSACTSAFEARATAIRPPAIENRLERTELWRYWRSKLQAEAAGGRRGRGGKGERGGCGESCEKTHVRRSFDSRFAPGPVPDGA